MTINIYLWNNYYLEYALHVTVILNNYYIEYVPLAAYSYLIIGD